MTQNIAESNDVDSYTNKQKLFIRYFTAILVDLTVLNLFDEYWDYVQIDSFSISLLAAILLQVLLKITLRIEHHIGEYFQTKPGVLAKILRLLSAWAILFGSKFVILEAVNIAFGDQVLFTGPLNGIVAFIIVVVAILAAEFLIMKFSKFLGRPEKANMNRK